MLRSLITPALLAFFFTACSQSSHSPMDAITLIGPDGQRVAIQAEIADEPAELERGLMHRSSLPDGQGMLFVFDGPLEQRHFWMKNTLIPLDILFFDDAGVLVSSTSMVPCPPEEERCMSYPSYGKARYALEVNAGFLEEHEVGEGWRMEWEKEKATT